MSKKLKIKITVKGTKDEITAALESIKVSLIDVDETELTFLTWEDDNSYTELGLLPQK